MPRKNIRYRGQIDLANEDLFSLSELCNKITVRREYSTLWQWCNYGRKNKRTGQIIPMESVDVGGVQHSSIEAYRRFILKFEE